MTKKRREFQKTLVRTDTEEEELEALPWEKDYLELKQSLVDKKKKVKDDADKAKADKKQLKENK